MLLQYSKNVFCFVFPGNIQPFSMRVQVFNKLAIANSIQQFYLIRDSLKMFNLLTCSRHIFTQLHDFDRSFKNTLQF